MMDLPEENDRNPSPPPELQSHPDLVEAESIGNTAFSKHWLFSTLMKLIEEVEKEKEDETEGEATLDVGEELQNELCKLWDMSMNAEVAEFLQEFKAVEILTGIIGKSKAPRVTEICVGILGNMACEGGVCKFMSENQNLIDLMLAMLEERDAPSLVEATRLIYTSLSNDAARSPWVNAIKRSEDVLGHLMFIFQSSTNCDLLKNAAELVDMLLDLETDLCVSWATEEFVGSLLEAIEQIGCSHSDALEVYLHIFQSLSTTETGVESLVAYDKKLQEMLVKYLDIVCEYEIVGLDGKEGSLASALSVLHILFRVHENTAVNLCKSERLMRILLKILEPLCPLLQQYKPDTGAGDSAVKQPIKNASNGHMVAIDQSESGDSSKAEKTPAEDTETEYRLLKMLYDVLSVFLVDFCLYFLTEGETAAGVRTASTEETRDNKSDATDDTNSGDDKGDHSEGERGDNCDKVKATGVNCLPILSYLNEACSRCRINHLIMTIREAEKSEKQLVEKLLNQARRHNLERLVRIISDVNSGRIVKRAESSIQSESSVS